MTEEEVRKLFRVIVEIGLGQDIRADKLVATSDKLLEAEKLQLEGIRRMEELQRGFAYLLEQVSLRLTEKDLNTLLEEAMDREKRLRKFERGNARPS